jgi:tetratricopeptide (TPR) repeat protein
MKRLILLVQVVVLSTYFLSTASAGMGLSNKRHLSYSNSNTVLNSISGQVWDPFNRPVSDVYVELMNELYMTVSRQRIYSGRFLFNNLRAGSYKVRVLTHGTDYLEQTQDVQIVNISAGSSDQAFLEFRLRFDPRKITLGSGGVPVEVFVQEGIADNARKHYRKGIELLADKKDAGFIEIEKALQISPNYFDALIRLGAENVQRKEYQKSLPYLIKAIEVNQRSFSAFYNLAYACYKLNHKNEMLDAAKAAVAIKPSSTEGQLLYGVTLRVNGTYDKAEQALLSAKSLSKKPVAEIHWQLALLYNRVGRNKEAVIELRIYLKMQPESPSNKKEVEDLIAKLENSTK